jgi:Glycosyltransferase like family 2
MKTRRIVILGVLAALAIQIAIYWQQLAPSRRAAGDALAVAWQHAVDYRQVVPIGVVGLLSWSVWLFRRTLSRLYRPVPGGFTTTTSVVVPSYREDPDIIERCLRSWLAENPTEVIVVPDYKDTEVIARLNQCGDPRLKVIPFVHRGKRSALGVGIRAASSEVVVLTDSDTQWEPGLLASVQAPFADPKVGGVGTRQNVYQGTSSVWRRVADWMIDVRYLDYVPSQGRAGAVACLSGRTAAYRRSAVMPVLGHLEHEFFLGRLCNSGDDGRLTWLILASGYRTVPGQPERLPQAAASLEPQLLPLLPHGDVEGVAVAAAAHLPAVRAPDHAHPADHGARAQLPGPLVLPSPAVGGDDRRRLAAARTRPARPLPPSRATR